MTADKTTAPEWIDVAFADGFGWSTYAAHEGDKTRFIRSDLCASGQQVRALEVDDLAQIIRVVDGNNTLGAGELAEAILEAMPAPRIVGALTPAPQAEAQVREAAHRILELYDEALRWLLDPGVHDAHPDSNEMAELRRIVGAPAHSWSPAPTSATPAWLARCCICGWIVDTREADAGGDPHGCELDDGRWVCSSDCWDAATELADPPQPSETVAEARRRAKILAALTPAPQPAGEAVLVSQDALIDLIGEFGREVCYMLDDCETSGPVGEEVHTITDESLTKVSAILDRIDALPFEEPGAILGTGAMLQAAIKQTFQTHPPQPSETVAEALKPFANMINHIETDTPDDYRPSWAEFLTVGDFRRAAAALRAYRQQRESGDE